MDIAGMDDAQRLKQVEDALTDSPLADDFTKVTFAVPMTVTVTPEPSPESLAPIADAVSTPLRIRHGGYLYRVADGMQSRFRVRRLDT